MDFKPKDEDLSFARVNTEPCAACCEMLERVRDAANLNLSGKNLEVFLTEIGLAFHGYVSVPSDYSWLWEPQSNRILRLLLEHMRKFPVSATGGLMLAKYVHINLAKQWHAFTRDHTEIFVRTRTRLRRSPSLPSRNASSFCASSDRSSSFVQMSSSRILQRITSAASTQSCSSHTSHNGATGVNPSGHSTTAFRARAPRPPRRRARGLAAALRG